MPTVNQLCKKIRKQHRKLEKSPALKKSPQKKGVCLKVFTKTPKKPNSALRKVARLRLSTQKKITNQVLMGEGSPFLNLDNVKVAIDNSKNKDGLEYGRTRITVSTVGVGLKKENKDSIEWAANELDVYLAWSLHSSISKHRSELMPINDKYSIKSLIPQMKKYYEKTKLPIFIEWICLDENLTDEHARELIKIMKKVPSKLNLIEFNPLSNKDFKPATQENIDKFSKIIQEAGFLSLFRRSRGRDINASCGSLANSKAILNG